jgi:two-component sensor histidine kinase
LLDELNHRVKNTLAIVQAMARQSFKGETLPKAARDAFEGRLAAYAAAHSLLTRKNWESADLHDLAAEAFQASASAKHRITINGPPVTLGPRQALAIAMAFHELGANAIKYGALAIDRGHVEVTWELTEGVNPRLKLEWRERDGPPVKPPTHSGFGTLMIQKALAHELQGEARLDFLPNGLHCIIAAPLNLPKPVS